VRPLSSKPAPQHIAVETATSAPAVTRGGRMTLYADVTPKASIHVYAEGAADFTPVSLTLVPRAGTTLLAATYPPAEKVTTVGTLVSVPAYKKPFRIAQPVVLASSMPPGEVVLTGVVSYQACDDRLCYPATAIPVRWTFTVK